MHVRSRGLWLALSAGAALLAAVPGSGQAPQENARVAVVAAIEGAIGPATVRHVERAIGAARARNAEILILRLNTPGGLATSMREIVTDILGSTVPVAGYVAPSGAHAASAGTYILYATHVAAMAPGTNIGAATPVQIGGGFPGAPQPGGKDDGGEGKDGGKAPQPSEEDAHMAKAVNDAVAFIRGLAELRGRNAEWAEQAVREAASISARPALERDVIDIVAPDVDALLAAMDGRKVTVSGKTVTLHTKGLAVEYLEVGFVTRLLGILSNPNVAFILLMIGVYGLIFELANPGSIGPGLLGAICLVLGLYSLNQLPLNYAGLALIAIGLGAMVAEAITPTFGALGIGGLAAFVIGAALLVDTDVPAFELSWWVIGGAAAASALVLVLLLGYLWRTYRRPLTRGGPTVVGAAGTVMDWADGAGHVWAEGERWSARGDRNLAAGEPVRVRGLDGLTLVVGRDPAKAEALERDRREKGA